MGYDERMINEGAKAGLQILGVNGSSVMIEVDGHPRTKGSLKPVHVRTGPGRCRVSLTEDGAYSEPWKKAMIAAIRAQCRVERYAEPVIVDCFFRFERLCMPDLGSPWPVRATGEYAHGDEDKLRRNVLDALTQSGLIADDSLSIGGTNLKRWVRGTESAGVMIGVRPAAFGAVEWLTDVESWWWQRS